MLATEKFIELLEKIDVFERENENFDSIFLEKKENTELLRSFFYNDKDIVRLLETIEEIKDLEKTEYILKKIILFFPLSKKLLDSLINTTNSSSKMYKIIIRNFAKMNNPFVQAMEEYVGNIHSNFRNQESIKKLEKVVENLKDENNKIQQLTQELEEYQAKNIEYKNKLKQRETLENKIKSLNMNEEDFQKEIDGLENDLKIKEGEIETLKYRKKEKEEKIKKSNQEKEKLIEELKMLEEGKLEEKERELISELVDFWKDN